MVTQEGSVEYATQREKFQSFDHWAIHGETAIIRLHSNEVGGDSVDGRGEF
jgi:hypothetical protein